MVKQTVFGGVVLAALASFAFAQPAYVNTWDFENGTVGQPHPDWNTDPWSPDGGNGTVQTNGPFSGTPYPSNKRLYTADGTDAWHELQAPTNSFIYRANAWTDAGTINALSSTGIGFYGPSDWFGGNPWDAWYEGEGSNGDDIKFGMPSLPNPRPGSGGDFQWPGGSGETMEYNGLTKGDAITGSAPQLLEAEFEVRYNTPGNPGTLEVWWRTISHNNTLANAGVWVQVGWETNGNIYDDFILGTDGGGNVSEISHIKLGGDFAWSQVAFDNVYFESIPEPASLSLLLLGMPLLLRRRRA
jgi:hypothetical protein